MDQPFDEPAHASPRELSLAGAKTLGLSLAAITGAAIALTVSGSGFRGLLLVTAILNISIAAYLVSRFPLNFLHLIVRLVVGATYRIRVHGTRLPENGGALLVCNHVSYVDAFVIGAVCPRPVRFVMSNRIYRKPAWNWFFRFTRAIPIASGQKDDLLLESAYEECARALAEGELICIFPEGKRSPDGAVSRFQPGLRNILQRASVPVIPMALQGLRDSVFSRNAAAQMPCPIKQGLRRQITIAVGEPVDPRDAAPMHLRQLVETLHRTNHFEGA